MSTPRGGARETATASNAASSSWQGTDGEQQQAEGRHGRREPELPAGSVQAAPSVQMQAIPPDLGVIRQDVEERIKEEAAERNDELRRVKEAGVATPMEF